jgi:hypothetical protein
VDPTRKAQVQALGEAVAEANRQVAQAYQQVMRWSDGDQEARAKALELLQSSARTLADTVRQASWL